jgi:hypothetical protein
MDWYKINISFNDVVNDHLDDLLVSLVKAHHALTVYLDSLALYKTALAGEGISFFLETKDKKLIEKLKQNFTLERAPQPELESLDPVYGYFLGEDVAELLGTEIKGERAPSSAPPFAAPYRGGRAGYGTKAGDAGNSDPARQTGAGMAGRAMGAAREEGFEENR